jgi:Tfp pilus assembly protein PilF
MDPFSRAANAFMVLGRYLMVLLVPWRLLSDYSLRSFPLVSGAGIILSVLIAAMFAGALLLAYRKRREHPSYIYGLALFIFPYFLISNIILPIGTIMGERLMYFPSAGIMLIGAAGIDSLWDRSRNTALALLTVILVFYAGQTILRNRDWYDDRTLTARDFQKAPENIKFLANLALDAKQNGNPVQAEQLYRKALAIFPDFAEGYSGMARLAYERGEVASASESYRKAADLAPNDFVMQFNYASVLIKQNLFDAAETRLRTAISHTPGAAMLYRSMGNLRMSQNRFQEAIDYFEQALRLGDTKEICYTNMAASAYYENNFNLAWSFVLRASAEHVTLDRELVGSIQQQMK